MLIDRRNVTIEPIEEPGMEGFALMQGPNWATIVPMPPGLRQAYDSRCLDIAILAKGILGMCFTKELILSPVFGIAGFTASTCVAAFGLIRLFRRCCQ